MNTKRIFDEFNIIHKNKNEYQNMYMVNMSDNDVYKWNVILYGPIDSPYAGKQFNLVVQIPSSYPQNPPTIKFLSKIKHINVNDNGDICLNSLTSNWKIYQTIQMLLTSIYLLLMNPNPNDIFNFELGEIYKKDFAKYLEIISN